MPAIHQTRLSTCGLTLSLQLLKYVVSNYWNMYATSAPRNTVSEALSPASNQEYYSSSQLRGLTLQSNQTVRGIGTMSGAQRHLTISRLPSICMKMEEVWDMDLAQMWDLDRGAFCMLSWSSDWLLAPPWKTLDDRAATESKKLNYWKSAQNSCCIILQ